VFPNKFRLFYHLYEGAADARLFLFSGCIGHDWFVYIDRNRDLRTNKNVINILLECPKREKKRWEHYSPEQVCQVLGPDHQVCIN